MAVPQASSKIERVYQAPKKKSEPEFDQDTSVSRPVVLGPLQSIHSRAIVIPFTRSSRFSAPQSGPPVRFQVDRGVLPIVSKRGGHALRWPRSMETLATADPGLVAEFLASDVAGEEWRKLSAEDAESQSKAIELFLSESENLVALSENVSKCDEILDSLERVLSKFDSTLDTASDEILEYQRQSGALFDELRDKREMREQVHQFVESLVLTQRLIRDINGAPVNSDIFARGLGELQQKLDCVNGSAIVRDSAAYKDVAIEMERLRLMAVKRGRDFILEKIYGLRQQGSNIQAQQNLLIKHRHIVIFLKEHGSNAYAEVRAEYCTIVSYKFMDVFKGYWASLEGMEKRDEGVLLGATPQVPSYYSYLESLFETKDGPEDAHEAFFQLGDRLVNSSRQIYQPPIMPSESRRGKEMFESIFASISRLLVDMAAHEYLFCKNFWQSGGRLVFRDTFKPILEFIHGSIAASLQDQNDIIALLLCININRQNFLLMTKRRNPALDEHFDAVNLLLWPRVKMVLDLHLKSVMDLELSEEGHKHVNVSDKDKVVPLTRRYAAMMASMLVIVEFITDGSISLNIEQLRYAVLNRLLTVSRRFHQRGQGTVFLLHNLHHVVTVLKAAGHSQESFDQAFLSAMNLYIDSKLQILLRNPKEVSIEGVKKLRQMIRTELRTDNDFGEALGEVVEKASMATLCERWNAYLGGEEDPSSLLSMSELFNSAIVEP